MEVKNSKKPQRSARFFSELSEAETPDLEGWLMLKEMGKTWMPGKARRHTQLSKGALNGGAAHLQGR